MSNRVLWFLGVLVSMMVLLSLWIAPVIHYWVSTPQVAPDIVERLRTVPDDSRLLEIEKQSLALSLDLSDAEVLKAANYLRTGEMRLKGYSPIAVAPQFEREDLRKGLPTWGLHFGSLAAVDIYARAYEISGDKVWLNAALQFAVGFIKHERAAWLPEGFLWNDHAIAARVGVLIRLWRLYRQQSDYSEVMGRVLIEHMLRCRGFLGKRSHFTFATNHGVIQNVGLLQIAAAFPGLPDEGEYLQLAIHRLDRQFSFYFSDEGVVLEHSAEYHVVGFHLIGIANQLMQTLGQPIPSRWNKLQQKAERFLDVIRLPDDSLPMFGNTNSTVDFQHDKTALSCAEKQGLHLYPVAGYAVNWHCGGHAAQTVLAWSQFVGHGHKHADELSLLVWARGTRWLNSVGYWPYGVPGDGEAYGWEGSNAPHWVGEATAGTRNPRLLTSAAADGMVFLDVVRNGIEGEFRRQVLQLGADWWIVLDAALASDATRAEVLWTFFPGVSLSPLRDDVYLATVGTSEMHVTIGGNVKASHRLAMAERSPWRGWVVKERVPTPAEAILVHFSGGAQPLLSTFHLADKGNGGNGKAELVTYRGLEDWELAVGATGGQRVRVLRRPDGHIIVSGLGVGSDAMLALQAAPDVRANREIIRSAYASLQDDFPRYREVLPYRLKATKLLVAVFVAQELILVLLLFYRRRLLTVVQLCSMGVWIGVGLGLHFWYFP